MSSTDSDPDSESGFGISLFGIEPFGDPDDPDPDPDPDPEPEPEPEPDPDPRKQRLRELITALSDLRDELSQSGGDS